MEACCLVVVVVVVFGGGGGGQSYEHPFIVYGSVKSFMNYSLTPSLSLTYLWRLNLRMCC